MILLLPFPFKSFVLHSPSSAPEAGNRNQLEALFDFATLGIVVTNDTGTIINFNAFAMGQFGYAKEEVLGQPVEILLPQSVWQRHQQYRSSFYEDPHNRSMGHGRDLFARRKDGSVFPVEVSLSHYQVDGRLYVIAFVIDITVRKKSEALLVEHKDELEKLTADLRHLNSELEEKINERTGLLQEALNELQHSQQELSVALQNEKELGELKSRFVTMASHEFRTPLSTILSSAYLAEQYTAQGNSDKATRHLGRIKESVSSMKNLLEDFLSLGKLEEGFVHADRQWLPAFTIFTDIQETLQQLESIKKAGQQLVLQTQSFSDSAAIYVDEQLLKNVLINLVTNAIKFSPPNSFISIGATWLQDEFKLSVTDAGIGITEEDQQHLFRRFFRAKSAANIPGTGLGLHIVAKYLELMQGTITCQSVYEQGTTFTVTIPQPVR